MIFNGNGNGNGNGSRELNGNGRHISAQDKNGREASEKVSQGFSPDNNHSNGNGNGHRKAEVGEMPQSDLMTSPLVPEGYYVPRSRSVHPSKRMRELLETEPYLFGPGCYDPMTAQLCMYYGFKAVYF